jgi:hypothetical protein
MPKLEIHRDIEIKKDQQTVIQYLANFQNWPAWSPWLIMQPDCILEYSGTQGELESSYRWNGHLVGAGEMTLKAKQTDRLEMQLVFFKPFRSKAKVTFHVRTAGQGSCKVEWSMYSALPWFLFFLKSMMEMTIRQDYDRGLLMLKSQLETDRVPSQVARVGTGSLPKQTYLGIRGRGAALQLGIIIQNDFSRLEEKLDELEIAASDVPFVMYEQMDMASGKFQFITAIPIPEPISVDAPFICASYGPLATFTVRHTGSYPFVGNAWSMAMVCARHEIIKLTKKPLGIERYLNDPHEVESKDLITDISLFQR